MKGWNGMGKCIVLYQSKYGATKKYADWLKERLGCDILETKAASMERLAPYDTVVFGGGIYASGIAGISFLKKHYDRLNGKTIAVFAVGASPYDEKAVEELRQRNLKAPLYKVPLFYFRGAWQEEKMSFGDRTLCNMLKKAVAKKDPNTYAPWEAALMEAMGSSHDWTSLDALAPLIDFLNR